MHLPSLDDLRRAARDVAETSGYRLVVLFGSMARGEPRAEDVDLGILGAAPLDTLDAATRFMRALECGAVDVADLARANPVLLMAVAREGIPLYEAAPAAFAEFSSLAMRRYADTKKFRDMEREDLRAYVARGRDA